MSEIEKIIRMADTYCRQNDPEKMNWSWGEALVMYSLSELDSLINEERYFKYYKRYADSHYKKGITVDQSDTCAPALITHRLYQKTGELPYREMTDAAVAYLKNEPRLIGDLINHNGHSRDSRDYPKSIWIDSLMMSGVFGSIAARDYGDEELMKFAMKQPDQFSRYLQDEETRLYHHSWWKRLNRAYPRKLFWGRGNGWAVASFAFMYRFTLSETCAEHLKDVSAALLEYQRDDFYFDTVFNKPGDNYRESSATALIAAGWLAGIREGILGQEYLEPAVKAFKAVVENFEYSGKDVYMTETSLWTIPMFFMPYRLRIGPYPGYKYVKKGRNVPYGVASLILAAVEYESLKKEQPDVE
ncbi:MAG: glycoside hydrolase family 88 protein [Spirochaetales bacterium]|nr:glycoside hydrolase family 88 protein [Spirochaetales bacterium]